MEDYEPTIIGFLCNWCSYAGADLAGISKIKYPPNIKIIRVMCTSRVDMAFVLESFRKGADGVFIGACHFGECHYKSGNYKANRRVKLLQKYLEEMGIEPKRVRFEFISASEGNKFAEVITDFVKELKELGPIPFAVEAEQA